MNTGGPPTKACITCAIVKRVGAFHNDRNQPDGKNRRCKECERRFRRPYDPVPAAAARYGITTNRYKELLDSQNGACAICGKKPTKGSLVVDHCHESGLVRGLVCRAHNTGVGLLGESLTTLISARKYLTRATS
jgi:hypothetical protein